MSHFANFSDAQLGSAYGSSNKGETTSTSSTMQNIKLMLSEHDFNFIKYDFSILVQNNIDKQSFFKHQRRNRFNYTTRIIIEKRDDTYMLVLSDGYPRYNKTFLILGDNCYIIKIIEKIPGNELKILFICRNDNTIDLFPNTLFFSNVNRDFQNLVNNMMDLKILETNILQTNKRNRRKENLSKKSSKGKRKGQKEKEKNHSPQQNIDLYNQGYKEFIQYDTFLGRLLYISYFMIYNKLYEEKNDNTDFFMIKI